MIKNNEEKKEKKKMQKMSITGDNLTVENHGSVPILKQDDASIAGDTTQTTSTSSSFNAPQDLSKEKSEISKIVVYSILAIMVSIIGAFFLSILVRPEGIKPTGDLLMIITPIVITGLLGFVTGLAIGRKNEK